MRLLPLDNVHPDQLLQEAIRAGCKELHLKTGQSPYTTRCDGKPLSPMPEYQVLTTLDIQQLIYVLLSDEQITRLEREGKGTFSYSIPKAGMAELALDANCIAHVLFSRHDVSVTFYIETHGL